MKVLFQHPRYIYYEAADSLAYDKALEEFPRASDYKSILDDMTPQYKKVGNSRKKVVYYTSGTGSSTPDEFYPRWRELTEKYSTESDFEVKTQFNIELSDWARVVSVVYPVELDTIEQMAAFKEKIILWMTQKEQFVPELCYNKQNYIEENK